MLNGSLMRVDFDCDATCTREPIYDAVRPNAADFGVDLMAEVLTFKPALGKRLLEYGQEDWGGEVRFLVATLGLLNARNVVQAEKVDHTQYNKKRAKSGKRPLFSHTLIKVRPNIVQHEQVAAGKSRAVRLHFVRGHFKHRQTGLFWWSMHARGDRELGKIEHEYEVEGK